MASQHTTSTSNSNSNSNSQKPALEARKADGTGNDRQHFNGGFHDGANDAAAGRLPAWHGTTHFRPVYAEAYAMGREAFSIEGAHPERSDDAWRTYTEAKSIRASDMPTFERLDALLDEARASAMPRSCLAYVGRLIGTEYDRGALAEYQYRVLKSKAHRLAGDIA